MAIRRFLFLVGWLSLASHGYGVEFLERSVIDSLGSNHGCEAIGCDVASCEAMGCDSLACDAQCDGDCDALGCEAIHCPLPSCFECCDSWTLLTEVMFLRRSDADDFPLITNQADGSTLLDAENLEFDHQAVPRYQLIRETCCCWGWDIGYFGTESWNTTRTVGGPESPVLQGPGIPFPSTAPGTAYQITYGTDLHSAEFNVRRRIDSCVVLLAGFRWIEIRDDLRTRTIAPNVSDIFSIDTNNHLYGIQIGADANLLEFGGRLRIDSIGRAGILANSADQTTRAPALTGFRPAIVDEINAREDHTAFVGELGLRAVFRLSSVLSLHGGYQVMWLDGLALAPDQIPVTDLVSPASANLDTGGTLFFHGATFGVQAIF